jgi:DNA-binding transcriptional LysR family regulator
MMHVRQILADLDELMTAGQSAGIGSVGKVRLGIRLPPVGEPIQGLLKTWHDQNPDVNVIIYEMSDHDILTAIEGRRLDLAFVAKHMLWPHAVAIPVYRERLLTALPKHHQLARRRALTWEMIKENTLLIQGWEESQSAREYYVSFMGKGVRFVTHSASKQSVLGLVGAGYGITLVTQSQAHVRIPGVVFRHILEENAELEVQLAWVPENKEATVGRFVSFMRELSVSRHLL